MATSHTACKIFSQTLVLLTTQLFLVSAAHAQLPDNYRLCADANAGLPAKIDACSSIINSGATSQRNLAISFSNRGVAYGRAGDHKRAAADLDVATRLIPTNAGWHMNRAVAHSKLEQHAATIEAATEAIRLNPSLFQAYSIRGATYAQQGDLRRAISDFSTAMRGNPNDARAYVNRALAYAKLGESDKAMDDVNAAINAQPTLAEAYFLRGRLLSQSGDLDRAIADFSLAIQHNQNHAKAYAYRAIAFQKKGDFDRAKADATNATKLDARTELILRGRPERLQSIDPAPKKFESNAIEKIETAAFIIGTYRIEPAKPWSCRGLPGC